MINYCINILQWLIIVYCIQDSFMSFVVYIIILYNDDLSLFLPHKIKKVKTNNLIAFRIGRVYIIIKNLWTN